jgi:hypothetical protein
MEPTDPRGTDGAGTQRQLPKIKDGKFTQGELSFDIDTSS